jgi:uroporphyrin-III C-methyltransferase
MFSTGKVYLVGAGPGHPELLTIKAAELIKAADVIVYDRLVQEEVLALARASAERIYMGKPVGKHHSRQDEVNELLVRKARDGKMVVRLKGGDPFLFGRGGEEAEFLADHEIPFEVIPGVCSALSAPLSAGIPVTHRDYSSAVSIVTGHNADSAEARFDWNALARSDTLVFLMAVHNAELIAERLIAAGRAPETPVAFIQMAFWHGEQVATGTLGDVVKVIKAHGIRPPATMVVGEVVRVRERLRGSQRDLQRRSDSDTRFQPAPAPDQLLRFAAGGLGAQLLGWALENRLFDRLDGPITSYDLAQELELNAEALSEILRTLVSLGLLESRPEGYGNLELASHYLTAHSPFSLRDLLLYNCAQMGHWQHVAEFARSGRSLAEAGRNGELHRSACEAKARFAAPAALERCADSDSSPAGIAGRQTAVAQPKHVLVIGWGGEAHREALLRRWPDAHVTLCNPACGAELPGERSPLDLVVLSGILECADVAQVDLTLAYAAVRLAPRGRLMLHDAFMPAGTLPAPGIALALLAQQIANPGRQEWSTERLSASLEHHGFTVLRSDTLFAGYAVILASPHGSGRAAAS